MITFEEKLSKINEKEKSLKIKDKALKAQKRKLISKQKSKENNINKTSLIRLTNIGTICERVYGKEINENQLKKLEAFLQEQETRGQFFSKALS